MSDGRLRFKDLFPALGFSGVASVLGVVGYMSAPELGEVAVVFPPWMDSNVIAQTIVQSGAQFVAPSKLASVFVIRLETHAAKRRLNEGGALFYVAAKGICGPTQPLATLRK